jgi:hypothetical protein
MSKRNYILRIRNDDTGPDAFWLIGPFATLEAACVFVEHGIDPDEANWQLLCLTDAETAQPLKLLAPKDAAEPQQRPYTAEELRIMRELPQ